MKRATLLKYSLKDAIVSGSLEIVDAIIKNEFKGKIPIDSNYNPFYFAISSNQPDIVKLLIKYEYSEETFEIKNSSDRHKSGHSKTKKVTPIDFAIQRNLPKIVSTLIGHPEANKEKALYTAVQENNIPIITLLLQAGANPYTRIRKKKIVSPSHIDHENAMELAVDKGYTEIFELFEAHLKKTAAKKTK